MSQRLMTTSSFSAGTSAKKRWEHSKAQFDELAKSTQRFRLWLETTLNDSSPGSQEPRDYSSSPSDSQST